MLTEDTKGRNGESVRFPRSLLAEVDTLASELTMIPGARPNRTAAMRFLVSEGIKAVKAQRGIK
jgi:hypothetical protein